MFAEATGDRQWIHVDPVRAAAGPFGGPIAHGYLTLALAPMFIAEVLVVEHLAAALNYGLNKVRFPAPVPVGGQLRGVVTLKAADVRPTGIEAVFTVVFELAGSDRPACVAEFVALYR
jgi:acyl dehydratase